MSGLLKLLNHSCKHKYKLKRSTKRGSKLRRLNAQKSIDYTPPEIDKTSFRRLITLVMGLCSSSSSKHKYKLKSSTKGGPKLQRLHSPKGIDYTPPEIDKTSFRINGTEGELYDIIQSLGLSGPDDLGISLRDWEARKMHLGCLCGSSEVKSFSFACFGSRASPNVDSSSQNAGISSNVDHGDHKNDEIQHVNGIKRCLSDASPASEVKSLDLDCCGSRVGPDVDSSSQNVEISSNVDDDDHHVHEIKRCLSDASPASKVESLDLDCCGSRVGPNVDSSCQNVRLGSNVGDGDNDQDEIHHDHGIKGVRPPFLIPLTDTRKYSVAVYALGLHGENECVETSDSCSLTTTNDDGDSSSTTNEKLSPDIRTRSIDGSTIGNEPPSYISPNGKVRRIVYSWTKGALLGRGSYGSVYEGITDGGFFLAVKEVSLLDQGVQGKQSIYQEISLLSKFEHENIVQYYGTCRDESTLYIFLELASKGSLLNLYHQYKLGDAPVSAYTRQILLGLKYLHDQNVVHRDIKCANILVDTNGIVKLADFGLAKSTNLKEMQSCKGTAFWMAPEVIRKRGYGLPADIWSLGCTVLEMLTSQLPYHPLECMQAVYRIGNSIPPDVPASISKVARDFILQCLQIDPSSRPTAAQLLDHPFVKGRHL
ncbi:Protein kinase domain-containing protein [Heracleum sosnowskyi]|uniref:mitogen-activated protein kinase kinase kinase n=1 Tax=Heracleum sosnowskyi TaxID=360622 RepID=A0AAD8LZG3_9APIA|nr:Protein kinase domain-containing protein [Heracleum sosnowskyi]